MLLSHGVSSSGCLFECCLVEGGKLLKGLIVKPGTRVCASIDIGYTANCLHLWFIST